MKGLRHFLGFILYIAMGFPLLLGGLSVAAIRPWATDPETRRSLVTDESFAALIESPDLAEMAPEVITVGKVTLIGKAAVKGFQASIPTAVVVATAVDAIDSSFAAFDRGDAYFSIDAKPLKGALKGGSDAFAAAYLEAAGTALPALPDLPTGTTLPAGASPTSPVVKKLLSTHIAAAADAEPDVWVIGDAGSRLDVSRIKIGTLSKGLVSDGLANAGLWLIVTGAGICFASVMVSDSDWRRRLGRMGARVIVPSAIVLAIGLAPRLFTGLPGGLIKLPDGVSSDNLPALVEYLKFVASKISGGFLTAGLIGVGLGTALASAKRAIPLSDDDEAIE